MAVAAVGVHLASVKAQQAPIGRYNVVTYATIEDPGDNVVVRRINSNGEVAGGFKRRGVRQTSSAMLLTASGPIDLAANQATDYGTSHGVNDAGEVAGSFNGDTALRPFRSLRGSAFQPLPVLQGDTGGAAYSINSLGDAVGYSSGPGGSTAVWWTRGGVISPLPAPPGMTSARALGINNVGDIVGAVGEAVRRAVLWRGKGSVVELGTLPGFSGSEAFSINNRGAIVGIAAGTAAAPNLTRAVLWEPGRSIRDLGSLSAGGFSRALDINVLGQVVGTSSSSDGDRAILWTPATGMLDLNALLNSSGLHLTEAVGINEVGTIVAIGHDASNQPSGGHDDHEQPKRVVLLIPAR